MKTLLQIALFKIAVIIFPACSFAQNEIKPNEKGFYDFDGEKIIEYFIPDSKYNTVYFFQPKFSSKESDFSRKIQYIKKTPDSYKIIDQQLYKNSLLSKKEYDVTISATYVIAKQVKDYSSITRSSITYNFAQSADTLIRFTTSEDDYWNMTNGSMSAYHCKLKPVYLEIDGERQKALKLSREEYFREGKSVAFNKREYLNLYFVKGIGLYYVEIRNMNIIYSTGEEDVFPLDKFEKMIYDSNVKNAEKSDKSNSYLSGNEMKKIPLRKLLEESKWYCVGMYYQSNGVGDAFEKDVEYVSVFDKNEKTFIISNPNILYRGSYQFIDKDSILICKGYEDGIKKDASFKVSIKGSKLILEQIREGNESSYDYEFEKK